MRAKVNSPMMETAAKQGISANQEAEIVASLGARSIVFVGMMGAGKSTIGRRLGVRLHLPFLDADHEIEAAAGMSIADIFSTHGEAYFRDGEARVIARLLESSPCVLATGGGAFMRQETRNLIRDKGVSIWLQADGDVILRRVRRRADRPLLQTPDPKAMIEKLIVEREPAYRLADLTIPSHDVPHEKIVDACVDALHTYLHPGHDSVRPVTSEQSSEQ